MEEWKNKAPPGGADPTGSVVGSVVQRYLIVAPVHDSLNVFYPGFQFSNC